MERIKRFFVFIGRSFIVLFQCWLLSLIIFRTIPIPFTPLMVQRCVENGTWGHKNWVSIENINASLPLAAITSEDPKFFNHFGFDFEQIQHAVETSQNGGKLRGASTISQQTAKNIWLLPMRSFIRKGIEACMTVGMECVWNKKRILEVYLNIIETGPNLFGMEASAQTYFKKSITTISSIESARMIAVLPNPIRWHPNDQTPFVQSKVRIIQSLKKYIDKDEFYWYKTKN